MISYLIRYNIVFVINVSVQQYNGRLLPDIILPMLLPLENPFKFHEDVLSLQPMTPPKRFDISPPCVGCSQGLGAFRFFFKKKVTGIYLLYPYLLFFLFSRRHQSKAGLAIVYNIFSGLTTYTLY